MKNPVKIDVQIDYAALAEARAEFEEALACEQRIAHLRERLVSHRRTAARLYKAAGIKVSDIRRIMLLEEPNE